MIDRTKCRAILEQNRMVGLRYISVAISAVVRNL